MFKIFGKHFLGLKRLMLKKAIYTLTIDCLIIEDHFFTFVK